MQNGERTKWSVTYSEMSGRLPEAVDETRLRPNSNSASSLSCPEQAVIAKEIPINTVKIFIVFFLYSKN